MVILIVDTNKGLTVGMTTLITMPLHKLVKRKLSGGGFISRGYSFDLYSTIATFNSSTEYDMHGFRLILLTVPIAHYTLPIEKKVLQQQQQINVKSCWKTLLHAVYVSM